MKKILFPLLCFGACYNLKAQCIDSWVYHSRKQYDTLYISYSCSSVCKNKIVCEIDLGFIEDDKFINLKIKNLELSKCDSVNIPVPKTFYIRTVCEEVTSSSKIY
jgi:hypothetical protein